MYFSYILYVIICVILRCFDMLSLLVFCADRVPHTFLKVRQYTSPACSGLANQCWLKQKHIIITLHAAMYANVYEYIYILWGGWNWKKLSWSLTNLYTTFVQGLWKKTRHAQNFTFRNGRYSVLCVLTIIVKLTSLSYIICQNLYCTLLVI